MAGKRIFETAFKISGQLDKSLPAAIKKAESLANALAKSYSTGAIKAAEQSAALKNAYANLAQTQNEAARFKQLLTDKAQALPQLQQAALAAKAAQQPYTDAKNALKELELEKAKLQLAKENLRLAQEEARAKKAALTSERGQLLQTAGVKSSASLNKAIEAEKDPARKLKLEDLRLKVETNEAAGRVQAGKLREITSQRQSTTERLKANATDIKAAKTAVEQRRGEYYGAVGKVDTLKSDIKNFDKSILKVRGELLKSGYDTQSLKAFASSAQRLRQAMTSIDRAAVSHIKTLEPLLRYEEYRKGATEEMRQVRAVQELRAQQTASKRQSDLQLERQIAASKIRGTLLPKLQPQLDAVKALSKYEDARRETQKQWDAMASKAFKIQRTRDLTESAERMEGYKAKYRETVALQQLGQYRPQIQSTLTEAKRLGLLRQPAELKPVEVKIEGLAQAQKLIAKNAAGKPADKLAQLTQAVETAKAFKQLKLELQANKQSFAEVNRQTAAIARTYKQQRQAVTQLQTQLKTAQTLERNIGKDLPAESAQRLTAHINQLANALTRSEANLKATAKNFEASKAAGQALKSTMTGQVSGISQLRAQLNAAGFSTSRFTSSLNAATSALERHTQALDSQQRFDNASDKLSKSYQDFQNATQTAQVLMTPFTSSLETAAAFEKQMSTVKSLTQLDNMRQNNTAAIESEMASLTELAKRLGMTTQFTSLEAAQGETFLARAGLKTPEILNALPHMLDLATSADTHDLGRMSDIVTDIMMAMRKTYTGELFSAENVQRTTDVLSYTFTHSNQNLEQLYETMKYAAPVATMFGSSLEETAAITKFMADSAVKASMAGTAMRAVMTRLVAPPKAATQAMEENGITVGNMTAEWLDANRVAESFGVTLNPALKAGQQMASVVRQINENMSDMSSQEKLAAFKAISGMHALSGATNLFENGGVLVQDPRDPNKQITWLEAFTYELENSGGSTHQVAEVMRGNYWGAKVGLESAFEAVKMNTGSAMLEPLTIAAKQLTTFTQQVAMFIDQHPRLVQAAASIAASFSGVIVAAAGFRLISATFGFVGSSAQLLGATVSNAFTGLPGKAKALGSAVLNLPQAFMAASRAAMAFAFSPAGAAMAALAITAVAVYKNWDRVAPVFEQLTGVISESLTAAIETVTPALNRAYESFKRLMDVIGESGAGELFAKGFIAGLDIIVGVFTTVIELASHLVALLADIAGGAAEVIANLWAGNFTGAKNAVNSLIQNSYKDAMGAIAAVPKGVVRTYESIEESWRIYDRFTKGTSAADRYKEVLNAPKLEHEQAAPAYRFESELNNQQEYHPSTLTEIMNRPESYYEPPEAARPENNIRIHHLKVEAENQRHITEQAKYQRQLQSITSNGYETANVPTYQPSFKSGVALPSTTPPAPERSLETYEKAVSEATPIIEYSKKVPTYQPSFKSGVALPSTTPPAPERKVQFEVEPVIKVNPQPDSDYSAIERYKNVQSPANLPVPVRYEPFTFDEMIQQANEAAAKIQQQREVPKAASVDVGAFFSKALTDTVANYLNPLNILTSTAAASPLNTENVQSQINALGNSSQYSAANIDSHTQNLSYALETNAVSNENYAQSLYAAQSAVNTTGNTFLQATQSTGEFSNMTQLANNTLNAANGSLTANNFAVQQSTAELYNNATATAQNAQAAITSAGQIMTLAGSAVTSAGAVDSLAGTSSSASGALSGLGAAAASAITALYNAVSSAGSSILNAVSSVFSFGGAAENYSGGIYNQGAFLTWFAEKSPEAAIPLDGSERAINLWQQAGAMLGVYPAENYNGGIYAPGGASIENSALTENINVAASNMTSAGDNFKSVAQSAGTFAKVSENFAVDITQASEEIRKPTFSEVIKDAFTAQSVKTQTALTNRLNAERDLKIGDKVKSSASFKAINNYGGRVRESATAPRPQSYGGAVETLLKGDVSGALNAGYEAYQKNAEAEQLPSAVGMKPALTVTETAAKVPAETAAAAAEAEKQSKPRKKIWEKWREAIFGGSRKPEATKRDELGNIKNLEIPEYNRITGAESNYEQSQKYQWQVEELHKQQRSRGKGGYKVSPVESKKGGNKAIGNALGLAAAGMMLPKVLGGGALGSLAGAIATPLIDQALMPKETTAQSGKAVIKQPSEPTTFKSVISDIFTPSSVKAQRQANNQLAFAREAKFNDKVKTSKSFQALQSGGRRGKSITAPEKKSYGGAIGALFRGDIGGALNAGYEAYQKNAEVEGLEKAIQNPQVQAAEAATKNDSALKAAEQTAPRKNFLQKGAEAAGQFFSGIFGKKNPEVETASVQAEAMRPTMKAAEQISNAEVSSQTLAAHTQHLEAINSEPIFNNTESSDAVSNNTESAAASSEPITFNLTINIQGNANREEVTNAVNAAYPPFEEQLRKFQIQQRRKGMGI